MWLKVCFCLFLSSPLVEKCVLGAKRIRFLFLSLQVDYSFDPKFTANIPDISLGDGVFSDGCGLISKNLAIQLSRSKATIFRGARYVPTVYQIR